MKITAVGVVQGPRGLPGPQGPVGEIPTDPQFDSITVTGESDLQGKVTAGGDVDVTGELKVTGESKLDGKVIAGADVDVTGDLEVTGGLTVIAPSAINGSLVSVQSLGTPSGNFTLPLSPSQIYVIYGETGEFSGIGTGAENVLFGPITITGVPTGILAVSATMSAVTSGKAFVCAYEFTNVSPFTVTFYITNASTASSATGRISYIVYAY